tara:strand:- start:763 stop:1932 length:1170 start_codon:yes stop_codon:yes gene_type:complete
MSAASHFFGGSNSEVPLRVLVVAGGGGSGGYSVSFPSSHSTPGSGGISGAGGGGAVQEVRSYPGKRGRTYNVTVGAGGTAGIAANGTDSATAEANRGGKGEDSVFTDPLGHTFTAEGGGGGGSGYSKSPTASWNGVPYAHNDAQGGDSTLSLGASGGTGGGGAAIETIGSSPHLQFISGGSGNAFANLGAAFISPGTINRSEDRLITTPYGEYGGFPSFRTVSPSTGNITDCVSGGAGRRIRGYHENAFQVESNAGTAENTELTIGNGYKSNIEGTMKSYGAGRPAVVPQSLLSNPNVPVAARYPTYSDYLPQPGTGHGAYGVIAHPATGATYGRWEGPGAVGSSGVVIVQYPSSFGNATTTGTVTDISSNTPGYKTYKFTTDGTIQLP